MTTCIECGHPWGVILGRGVEPSDEEARLAQSELEALYIEQVSGDLDEGEAVEIGLLPKVRSVQVVYVSPALADFVTDRPGGWALEECWQPLDATKIPAWLLKGRKTRWAYCWDCCDMGAVTNYMKEGAGA